MSITRSTKDSEHPYTRVSNGFIYDCRLSLRSKALLLFVLSKPDSWLFNYPDVLRFSSDGIRSVRTSVRELIEFGYCIIRQGHRPNGDFDYSIHLFFEKPLKLNSIKTAIPAHGSFAYTLAAHTLAAHTLDGFTLNNKIKKLLREETTTTPTYVVNTKAVVVSPADLKKKEECIALCTKLYICNPHSLIKKYSLNAIYKNIVSFSRYISNAGNPTGCLISSIKENWIPHISQKGIPAPHALEQVCSKCLKYFYYLDFKPTRTICSKCET